MHVIDLYAREWTYPVPRAATPRRVRETVEERRRDGIDLEGGLVSIQNKLIADVGQHVQRFNDC